VVVTQVQLLGDSMKKINERIAKNINVLKQAGRLPAEVVLTAEELLKSDKIQMTDFAPAISAQTGRYGLARVWSKDRGFWDQNLATAPAAAGNPGQAAIIAQIENLQKMLAASAVPPTVPTSPAPVNTEANEISQDPFAG